MSAAKPSCPEVGAGSAKAGARTGSNGMTRSLSPADLSEAAARLAARSCQAQGLPPTVTDPPTLAKVAALVTRNGNAGPCKAGAAPSLTTTDSGKRGGRRRG